MLWHSIIGKPQRVKTTYSDICFLTRPCSPICLRLFDETGLLSLSMLIQSSSILHPVTGQLWLTMPNQLVGSRQHKLHALRGCDLACPSLSSSAVQPCCFRRTGNYIPGSIPELLGTLNKAIPQVSIVIGWRPLVHRIPVPNPFSWVLSLFCHVFHVSLFEDTPRLIWQTTSRGRSM